MAVTEYSDGSQTATLDTEHTLDTITDPGSFVLNVDLNAMQAADTVLLRVKLMTRSGGTTRLHQVQSFTNAQTELIAISNPVANVHELVFTLEQTDGTGRAYPWSIFQLDG